MRTTTQTRRQSRRGHTASPPPAAARAWAVRCSPCRRSSLVARHLPCLPIARYYRRSAACLRVAASRRRLVCPDSRSRRRISSELESVTSLVTTHNATTHARTDAKATPFAFCPCTPRSVGNGSRPGMCGLLRGEGSREAILCLGVHMNPQISNLT